jgi:hypothetical protein
LAHHMKRPDPPFLKRTQAEVATPVADALAVQKVPAAATMLSEVPAVYTVAIYRIVYVGNDRNYCDE